MKILILILLITFKSSYAQKNECEFVMTNEHDFEKNLTDRYNSIDSDTTCILTYIMNSNGYRGRAVYFYKKNGNVFVQPVINKQGKLSFKRPTKKMKRLCESYLADKIFENSSPFKSVESTFYLDHPTITTMHAKTQNTCWKIQYKNPDPKDIRCILAAQLSNELNSKKRYFR